MPDQTYASLPQQNRSNTQQPAPLEPDQVENVPHQANQVTDKKEVLEELGGTGSAIVGGFLTGQDYNPDFTGTKRINLFDEMRLSDGTVRSGLLAVKFPILSADWYVKEPSGDEKLGPVADFVHRQLFRNKGFTFTQFLRQALTMVDYGNAVFEKVFETTADKKIGWKRLAPRML